MRAFHFARCPSRRGKDTLDAGLDAVGARGFLVAANFSPTAGDAAAQAVVLCGMGGDAVGVVAGMRARHNVRPVPGREGRWG